LPHKPGSERKNEILRLRIVWDVAVCEKSVAERLREAREELARPTNLAGSIMRRRPQMQRTSCVIDSDCRS
jgi:hypothetical protein